MSVGVVAMVAPSCWCCRRCCCEGRPERRLLLLLLLLPLLLLVVVSMLLDVFVARDGCGGVLQPVVVCVFWGSVCPNSLLLAFVCSHELVRPSVHRVVFIALSMRC
jgi:hypothetical protein